MGLVATPGNGRNRRPPAPPGRRSAQPKGQRAAHRLAQERAARSSFSPVMRITSPCMGPSIQEGPGQQGRDPHEDPARSPRAQGDRRAGRRRPQGPRPRPRRFRHPDVWHTVGACRTCSASGDPGSAGRGTPPGHDLSGIIGDVGGRVIRFRRDDEVFGETLPANLWRPPRRLSLLPAAVSARSSPLSPESHEPAGQTP
jgi:hypothetical protein